MARVVIRRDALGEILRLKSLERRLYELAQVGADAGGEGYVARHDVQPARARAAVIAAYYVARRDNARNHTLMGRVVDAMKQAAG